MIAANILRRFRQAARAGLANLLLPKAARNEIRHDCAGLPEYDPGIEAAVASSIEWLCQAQDLSASNDGGVARHFSLISGWSTSYPETTGYIIPTVLDYAGRRNDDNLARRAKRMLDWLVSIQLPDGSFQGGRVDSKPKVAVTFNTGQILFGLASGVEHLGHEYLEPMRRAASWLVEVQDSDGAWRKHLSPFAPPGPHTYETHVGASLLEAARVDPDSRFADAAAANVRWALSEQDDDGWLDNASLTEDQGKPLTHSLGYALRGILEAFRYSKDASFLRAGQKLADRLLELMSDDGFLPGMIDREWRGAVPWACLTGTVQLSFCWLLLYALTGDSRYRDAGFLANQYVRRTVSLDGSRDVRGGVKGSFPVDGAYCQFEYPSWACKFFVDANLLELDIRNRALESSLASS